MKTFSFLAVLLMSLVFSSCSNNSETNSNTEGMNSAGSNVTLLSYSVVGTFPHDTSSFTEGLEFYNGQLLESTGNYGKSKLLALDVQTGKPIRQVALDNKYFGEGITVVNDTLYQLTWKERTVLVYTAKDFKKIKEMPFSNDGWGMTNDGKNIIASDGSSNLYFYDPTTFKLLRTQGVTEDGNPVVNINELEYINGYIYANQWQYNDIIKIDPNSGQVVAKLDFTQIIDRLKAKVPGIDTESMATMNGIAYNPQANKIYITGKNWPEIYEVQFEH